MPEIRKPSELGLFVGKRLKELRVAQGMTKTDISRMVGKSSAAIWQYENGLVLPTVETLLLFSNVYDVPIDSIVNKDYQNG